MQQPEFHSAPSAADLSDLRALFARSPDDLAPFCAEIAEALTLVAGELRTACANGAWQIARAKAHELRGLSGNVGARAFSAQCAEFEERVAREPATALSILPALSDTCRHVCAELLQS